LEGETQHEEWTKVKHVPTARVVAVFDGSWRGKIRWRKVSSSAPSPAASRSYLVFDTATIPSAGAEYTTLIDLAVLRAIPKTVRPIERQLPYESRKLWKDVTRNLTEKKYSEATKEKVQIEQRQRDVAAERKRKSIECVEFFLLLAFLGG
jgi:hypothetical protein